MKSRHSAQNPMVREAAATEAKSDIEALRVGSEYGARSNFESPAAKPRWEQIAPLAYEYWQQRGCPEGCPEEDWFRAERELASSSSR